VDRIVEVALAPNLPLDIGTAAANATISVYATDGGEHATVPVLRLMSRNLALRFVLLYTVPQEALRQAVCDVTDAVRAGALTTLPLHRFSLNHTADAHDAVERGTVGKVLIDIP
jgi:NADPH2:quinone reductase